MKASRLGSRLRVVPLAARRALSRRTRPAHPRRILVAHHLLPGDVFMLAPLLAKLRAGYPRAEIAMTVRPALVPLFSGRPYGVRAIAYDPRDAATLHPLFDETFDLALVPGDNRYSWLAAGAQARWIVAFEGDRPGYKSWPVDEERPFPGTPMAWGDIVATLVDGPPPAPYRPGDWPAPDAATFPLPQSPYAVLHVGAGSILRLWQPDKWRAVASALEARGISVVWSAGPGEAPIVNEIDPQQLRSSYAGKLDLAQMWHLLAGAVGLFTLDTSIAHLAKLVSVRTVALFGPGSPVLFGRGDFWRNAPFREVTIPDFPCRDQRTLFKRRIEWVRRCQRTPAECAEPRCMHAIGVEQVLAAAASLGVHAR
jgi:ADP-heptose:LPS heptosyltransferase